MMILDFSLVFLTELVISSDLNASAAMQGTANESSPVPATLVGAEVFDPQSGATIFFREITNHNGYPIDVDVHLDSLYETALRSDSGRAPSQVLAALYGAGSDSPPEVTGRILGGTYESFAVAGEGAKVVRSVRVPANGRAVLRQILSEPTRTYWSAEFRVLDQRRSTEAAAERTAKKAEPRRAVQPCLHAKDSDLGSGTIYHRCAPAFESTQRTLDSPPRGAVRIRPIAPKGLSGADKRAPQTAGASTPLPTVSFRIRWAIERSKAAAGMGETLERLSSLIAQVEYKLIEEGKLGRAIGWTRGELMSWSSEVESDYLMWGNTALLEELRILERELKDLARPSGKTMPRAELPKGLDRFPFTTPQGVELGGATPLDEYLVPIAVRTRLAELVTPSERTALNSRRLEYRNALRKVIKSAEELDKIKEKSIETVHELAEYTAAVQFLSGAAHAAVLVYGGVAASPATAKKLAQAAAAIEFILLRKPDVLAPTAGVPDFLGMVLTLENANAEADQIRAAHAEAVAMAKGQMDLLLHRIATLEAVLDLARQASPSDRREYDAILRSFPDAIERFESEWNPRLDVLDKEVNRQVGIAQGR